MTVHHIAVNPIGARGIDCTDLLGELAEVRRQNGWGNQDRALHE
jgi:hypothetical protein